MLDWREHLKSLRKKWAVRYLNHERGAWKEALDWFVCKGNTIGRGVLMGTGSLPTGPNAFWDADMDLGLAGEMSGTTATVALVEQHANGNSLAVVLAWVGDSAAIRVDMEMKPEHALVESTPMHKRAAGRTSERASTHDITATRTLSGALALWARACAAAALSLRTRAACLTPVA